VGTSIDAFATVSIGIRAAPATVWSLVRDVDKAALTNPLLVSAARIEGSPLGIGERQLHVYEIGGQLAELEFEILDEVAGHRIAARQGKYVETYDLEYFPESGTTVMMRLGWPRSIRPVCCRTKDPLRPWRTPDTRSMAT